MIKETVIIYMYVFFMRSQNLASHFCIILLGPTWSNDPAFSCLAFLSKVSCREQFLYVTLCSEDPGFCEFIDNFDHLLCTFSSENVKA